jgi:hypothetical protein
MHSPVFHCSRPASKSRRLRPPVLAADDPRARRSAAGALLHFGSKHERRSDPTQTSGERTLTVGAEPADQRGSVARAIGGPVFDAISKPPVAQLSGRPASMGHRRAFYGPTSECTPIRVIAGAPAPKYLPPRRPGAQCQPWVSTGAGATSEPIQTRKTATFRRASGRVGRKAETVAMDVQRRSERGLDEGASFQAGATPPSACRPATAASPRRWSTPHNRSAARSAPRC